MVNFLLRYQSAKLLGAATTVQRRATGKESYYFERTCRFHLPFGISNRPSFFSFI